MDQHLQRYRAPQAGSAGSAGRLRSRTRRNTALPSTTTPCASEVGGRGAAIDARKHGSPPSHASTHAGLRPGDDVHAAAVPSGRASVTLRCSLQCIHPRERPLSGPRRQRLPVEGRARRRTPDGKPSGRRVHHGQPNPASRRRQTPELPGVPLRRVRSHHRGRKTGTRLRHDGARVLIRRRSGTRKRR